MSGNSRHVPDVLVNSDYVGSSSRGSDDIKNKGVKRMKNNQVASSSIWKPITPPPPPWLELPEDIMMKIFHKLGPTEILRTAQTVCPTWRKICRDPTMWRVIDMWKLRDVDYIKVFPMNGFNDMIFNLALDLSQGQATEINIQEFGSDQLIKEIAQRCGQLRCLRLAFCYNVLWKSFGKVVKFPVLEELHLQCTYVDKDSIGAIGRSCPMLKIFALNGPGCDEFGVLKCSEVTLAIAKSMPELHHLQLYGNGMTNDTLEVILNGCPKLESLDLRQCLNLNLEGRLGKRCAQLIKMFRGPYSSTHDYEWDGKIPYWVACDSDGFDDSDDSDDDFHYDDIYYEDFNYDDSLSI